MICEIFLQIQDQRQLPSQGAIPTGNLEENGTSVLDGILPKDFGSLTKDEKSNVTFQTNNNGTTAVHNSGNNGLLPNLLDCKQTNSNDMHINKTYVNGMQNNKTGTYIANNIPVENQTNVKQINGGLETTIVASPAVTSLVQNQPTLKRPASSENVDGQSPAKKVFLDHQQLTNGSINSNGQSDLADVDESNPILKTDVNLSQAAVNNQGVSVVQQQQKIQVSQPTDQQQVTGNAILPQQQTQRILTTADGKQILVKSPAQGNVIPVQHQQLATPGSQNTPGAKTIIILQPQNKVLNAQGQTQPTMLMTQPNTACATPGNLQPQVIMQGGQQVGTVTPITYMNAQSLPPASVMAVAGGYSAQNGTPVTHIITQPHTNFVNGGQTASSAINNSQNVQHARHSSGSSASASTGNNIMRQSPTPPNQGTHQQAQRVQSPLPPSVAASIANVSLPNSVPGFSANNISSPSPTASSQNSQSSTATNVSNSVSQQMTHPTLPQTPHPPSTHLTTIQPQYVPVPQGVLPPPNPQRPFICEWAGCMKDFRTPKEVEKHAIIVHCAYVSGQDDMPCLWSRCDGMKRKRFSLMTHIQDRHCHPQV